MTLFALPQKKKYDKEEYRTVAKDNPMAKDAADQAFFAKHQDLKKGGFHPFKVHRPGPLAELDLLNLTGLKGERDRVGKLREEYWTYFREAEILEKKLKTISGEVGRPVKRCAKPQKNCKVQKVTLQCKHHPKRSCSLVLPPDAKTWETNPNRTLEVVGGSKAAIDDIKVSLVPPKTSLPARARARSGPSTSRSSRRT